MAFQVGDRVRVDAQALAEVECENEDQVKNGGYIVELDENEAFIADEPGKTEGTYIRLSALSPYSA